MKKFNFSLQKILEVKKQILKNLKSELNNMNMQMKNIDTEILSLKEKFECTNMEFVNKSTVSISIGEIYYYKSYMNNILRHIEMKEEEKKLLSKKIDSKRNEIMNMNMEILSLEKLKDKEYEKYNLILMKNEEIFMDEFISGAKMLKQYTF